MTARANHLKSCASKNGLTTEKLLRLKRLEETRAEERLALGLPASIPNPDQAAADNNPPSLAHDDAKKKQTAAKSKSRSNNAASKLTAQVLRQSQFIL